MKVKQMALVCALVCIASLALAQSAGKQDPKLARGKYIVTRIGLCGDCHTPRNEKGEPMAAKELQGAPIMFQPAIQMPWAGTAPPIAGMEGYTDEQAIKFLTTGVKKDGKQPMPPMPPYRMSKADAESVLAYLRSLKASPADAQMKK